MEKRLCHRFNIPGTVIFYKKDTLLGTKDNYPDEYFPVLDISRGGLRFLTNERPKIGLPVTLKLSIPDMDQQPEIKGTVQWISRNREESYRYQAGIAFNAYGDGKKENPPELLSFMKVIESEYSSGNQEQSAG
jgi:Tfp pilus assembly protein PilZ